MSNSDIYTVTVMVIHTIASEIMDAITQQQQDNYANGNATGASGYDTLTHVNDVV